MKMTPEDFAYLRQAAARDGYSADDAMQVFKYESSLRPDVWGGKGGKYYGIFQAGPSERAQFGIDTQHPSARNQIDAFGRFLEARGYKPGMGLQDMYSTVLAGSPGHYNRSDGAGTVAQHVARMQGEPLVNASPASVNASPPGLSLSSRPSDIPVDALAFSASPSPAPAGRADPLGDLIVQMSGQPKKPAGNLTAFVQSLLAEQEPKKQADSTDDAFLRQMMDFHQAQHMRAVKGLL